MTAVGTGFVVSIHGVNLVCKGWLVSHKVKFSILILKSIIQKLGEAFVHVKHCTKKYNVCEYLVINLGIMLTTIPVLFSACSLQTQHQP